ncbi:MAG: redox-regulated ATPase YchF [Thermoplasmata archaeon]
MSVKIGLIGKPNAGKSTFFSAATQSEAEIGNYPFTTVKPNIGVTFFKTRCPDQDISKKCEPNEGKCENGERYIPIQIIDVPGLIEGASEGKGMGNEFLDNIRDVDAIILLFDLSGKDEYNQSKPWEDIRTVRNELIKWISSRIYSDWEHFARHADSSDDRMSKALLRKISVFGIREKDVSVILEKEFFPAKFMLWTEDDAIKLAEAILKYSKPMVIVGNKADIAPEDYMKKVLEDFPGTFFVSAEYELALKKARNSGLISSLDLDFKIIGGSAKQKEALEMIRRKLSENGITRIYDLIERIAKYYLKYIVVYPVYDESKWTDKAGHVLPDAFVMQEGSTALDLAYRVHTDIGDGFIRAVNARSATILGKDYVLKDGDVIRIISKK